MKGWARVLIGLAGVGVVGGMARGVWGQTLMPTGVVPNGSYSETFDSALGLVSQTIGGNGVSAALPAWLFSMSGNVVPHNGTATSGGIYNFGTGVTPVADTDRALGSIGGPTVGTVKYGWVFSNETGRDFSTVTVSFKAEQWRLNMNAAAQTLGFEYAVGSGVGLSTPGVAEVGMSFVTPQTGLTGVALNGHLAGNSASLSKTITLATPWTSGTQLILRWVDVNDAGNDHSLAIDNVSLSVDGGTESLPPALVWKGGVSSAWNMSEGNFANAGGSAVFHAQDSVRFDDTAGVFEVRVPGDVSPKHVSVASGTYTFSGGTTVRAGGNLVVSAGRSSWDENVEVAGTATFAGGVVSFAAGRMITAGVVVVSGGAVTLPGNAGGGYGVVMAAGRVEVSGGTVVVPAFTGSSPGVVKVDRVSVVGAGFVDLGNNDMVVGNADLPGLRGALRAWYLGAGNVGLGSSAADRWVTSLVLFGNEGGAGAGYYSSYDGVGLGAGSAVVKYSYVGDSNVDGVLDGVDAAAMISAISTGAYRYSADANFDGVVDAADWGLLEVAMENYWGPLSSGQGEGSGGAIPEGRAGWAVVGLGLLGKRRRALDGARR